MTQPAEGFFNSLTRGAVGAGLVLVVLPSAALFFGAERLTEQPIVGLPLVAIFGIMILFGALALTSTLFARLCLDDKSQALALPRGSIRAVVALALIVLFAIIAILLNEGPARRVALPHLSQAQRDALLEHASERVVASSMVCLRGANVAPPSSPADDACTDGTPIYNLQMAAPPDPSRQDLAKQLLTLIGTLVTSVVSFYFGARTAQAKAKLDSSGSSPAPSPTPAPNVAPAADATPTPDATPAPDGTPASTDDTARAMSEVLRKRQRNLQVDARHV